MPPPTVVVRESREGDLPALLALYVQLSDHNVSTGLADARAAFDQILSDPNVFLLVAEVDRAVAGTVMLVVCPGLTHGGRPWAQLENMVVDGVARRSGVGRALIDACAALAQERGCYKVQLQSANEREEAHRFYEAAGFMASSVGFRRYFD